MRSKLFFFTLVLSSATVFAQNKVDSAAAAVPVQEVVIANKKEKSVEKKSDSILKSGYVTQNPIYRHEFKKDFQKSYQGDEYDYRLNKPSVSIWKRIMNFINDILSKIFGKTNPGDISTSILIFLRLLAIVAIGFVIYIIVRFVLSRNGNWIFGKKNKKLNPDDRTITENIHELNLPAIIGDYEDKGNYRAAIRYQFLLLLKRLTDKKMIEWDPEKTNKDYYRSLSGKLIKEDFQKLSYIFENVWYGERDVNAAEYEVFRDQFLTAIQKI